MSGKKRKHSDVAESPPPASPEIIPCSSGEKLLAIEYNLVQKLKTVKLESIIVYVYNPLEYAADLHSKFIRKYMTTNDKRIMFLGMNPGPWGMSQTGIPFGEHTIVKEWFQVTGQVGRPEKEHPQRKITGLGCTRSEVSGRRFWGLFKQLCKTPQNFFQHSFVYNICPLAFLTESGRNITPAELKPNDQKILNSVCDEAFVSIVKELNTKIIIGIGKFAEKRAMTALKHENISDLKISSIPHPSPRNLKNSKNWPEATTAQLQHLGLMKYFTE